MYLRIYINILIFITVVRNIVLGGCIKCSEIKVCCDETSTISEDYFKKTIGSLKDVKKIFIRYNENLEISRDSFNAALNVTIIKIQLNNIEKLYGNTFADLPNLSSIYLECNNISEVDQSTFVNLTSTIFISISDNKLEIVRKETFKDLPALEVLNLNSNKISILEEQALANLSSLTTLGLYDNNLKTVFIHKILSHPEKLKDLIVNDNKLTFVSNYMLERLKNLENLWLQHNNIGSIEEGSFEQTPKLVYLDLSFNHLQKIDENIFPVKGLLFLKLFYLSHNHLMYLPFNFFTKMNNLASMTLFGNPWFCHCWERITLILHEKRIKELCQIHYNNGQRPICVVDNSEIKRCNFQYDDKLSEKYITALKQYPLDNCYTPFR